MKGICLRSPWNSLRNLRFSQNTVYTLVSVPAQFFMLYGKIWFACGQQGFQHTEWKRNMCTYNYITIQYKIANKMRLIPTKKYSKTFRIRYTILSLHNMSVQARCLLTFRHRSFFMQDRCFATLQRTLFIYLINKYISLSDICLTVHHWYK